MATEFEQNLSTVITKYLNNYNVKTYKIQEKTYETRTLGVHPDLNFKVIFMVSSFSLFSGTLEVVYMYKAFQEWSGGFEEIDLTLMSDRSSPMLINNTLHLGSLSAND